jgi:hypothetical protein
MLRVLHDIPLYFQRLTSADGGCMRHTCDMSRVLQPKLSTFPTARKK